MLVSGCNIWQRFNKVPYRSFIGIKAIPIAISFPWLLLSYPLTHYRWTNKPHNITKDQKNKKLRRNSVHKQISKSIATLVFIFDIFLI